MNTADVDYRGSRGTTQSCLEALGYALMEYRCSGIAALISGPADEHACRSHLFILSPGYGRQTVIRDGFASGYGGEGPAGLKRAILLLDNWQWDIGEIRVDDPTFERIASGAISHTALEEVLKQRRYPVSEVFYRYLSREDLDDRETQNPWASIPVALPLPLLDRRLHDLTVRFWENPDAVLSRGYRRLEDLVRAKTDIDEHGAKLFSRAFGNESSPLTWELNDAESRANAQLFIAAFSAFRNARAHRELNDDEHQIVTELIHLNTLFVLESRLVRRTTEAGDGFAIGKSGKEFQ